ncbi:hypothetical protein IFM89_033836 [Coptis chinensis]|uniref:Uncharacterized protein n=1 Tax=Coptis chinensis TaxID=261450 RepID=A0A835HQM2_9MAGN|nr:hypothetical protein IFM89_033836 [Coptis chinensis]
MIQDGDSKEKWQGEASKREQGEDNPEKGKNGEEQKYANDSGVKLIYFHPDIIAGIHDILRPMLNECVTPVTCYWSLALIMRGEAELMLVFWRKLVQVGLSADSSGGISSSFSLVTPSAVFQVIIGGGGGGGFIGSGGVVVAASFGGGAAAAEAPTAEEKKEEKEESDDDIGVSLFD